MRQRSARSGSRLSMIGACEQTTGRRTPISRYDAENENCSGSNHPAQPNVSLPSMPQHSTHSPINVICCADRISRSFAPVHSALGPGHPPSHDACCPLHSPRLNADNVTKPPCLLSSPPLWHRARDRRQLPTTFVAYGCVPSSLASLAGLHLVCSGQQAIGFHHVLRLRTALPCGPSQ